MSTAILGVRPSAGKPLPRPSRPRRLLRVPGAPRQAYFVQQDSDGALWLLAPRRSAPDEHGRSGLLREPELSWCLAEAAMPMARNAGATGVRIEDECTGLLYELGLEEFIAQSVPHRSPGYERQRGVPLRLWRVRPSHRPITPQGVQLSLFAAAEEMVR